MHTALVYLNDAVGSPTLVINQEDGGGAWFFEGGAGSVLHFNGSSLYHGALPGIGTEFNSTRIVLAIGFWDAPCMEHGRTCVRHVETTVDSVVRVWRQNGGICEMEDVEEKETPESLEVEVCSSPLYVRAGGQGF
jgi:hypothetical protein